MLTWYYLLMSASVAVCFGCAISALLAHIGGFAYAVLTVILGGFLTWQTTKLIFIEAEMRRISPNPMLLQFIVLTLILLVLFSIPFTFLLRWVNKRASQFIKKG